METKYCVYCHTSPSGKRYIGVTGRKPEKRWNYGKGYVENPYFIKAINKYGWESFAHEILFDGLTREEASRLEKELIAKYETTNRSKGYNIDLGGLYGDKSLSEETKKKIGNSHRGRFTEAQWDAVRKRKPIEYHHTDEIKKIIGDSHRGKPLSEEHKQKLSTAHKGIKPTNIEALRRCNMKPINQYDLDGNFVAKHESIRQAANALGICEQSISACLRGKTRLAGNYVWRYVA